MSRNIKGEIKTAITEAVKKLYELVKETEAELKREELPINKTYNIDGNGNTRSTPQIDTEKLEEQIKRLEKENDRMEETSKQLKEDIKALNTQQGNSIVEEMKMELREYRREEEEREKRIEGKILTYAEAAAIKQRNTETKKDETNKTLNKRGQMHSIIIKSAGTETSEKLLERIRNTVDAKNTGLNVDKIRKVKDQKIVIGCTTTERLDKITDRLKTDSSYIVETAITKDPLVVLRDVIKAHTDEDVVFALKNQNRNLFKDLQRRARNPHTENIILQVSPRVWKMLTEAKRAHIDLQRVSVQDQTPLIQCSRCLGYGHGRKYCKEADPTCSHCGGSHLKVDCPDHTVGVPPVCVNCRKANTGPNAHNAFDIECPVRKRWDMLARSPVAYC
ncbi:unnamed protein product [Pieris macdunnoughi]|uniref:Gag-like protein n=1 Tax=Pieris macdunnoughi TaxID=345717 RepID=A0A821Q2A9_9NEOP|nr:unnamed protein product [Pieris macdunnoughi]